MYASISTGIGTSLNTTCPVTSEIDSSTPSTGETALDLKNPNTPFVSASNSPSLISEPISTSITSAMS